ncbi:exodeoxyribonuclease V subunit beta [Gallaecimonas kandeliae]|uniref:exodeoxyribonuclease V subunit beta n=1 Tax=Gallaecimonas kandeliae TaxID=3029055 RepID=UPI002646FFFE|nr:exodeoxyribonuclease V subunit beta [Gallaecimonas kandeliae]WKE66223.1 exodeoxyribonuclease V subunit beta [Gallaecimonas kandeliae]
MKFQQLDPLAFPLHGSRLIEASAGTGKTYTIAALYLRLVLGSPDGQEAPLTPPQILVVTFTEAATQELKDRIRARLTEAGAVFAGAGTDDALLQSLKAGFAEPHWPGCAHRLALAAQWMDEAAIHTIHGWCNRMLRAHAFASGSLFDLRLETDLSALLDQAVKDYWRRHYYPLPSRQLLGVLDHWPGPEALKAKIKPWLELAEPQSGDLGQLLAEQQAQRLAALAPLKAQWRQWLPELAELLTQALDAKVLSGTYVKRPTLEKFLNGLGDWLADEPQLAPELPDSAWSRFTPEGLAGAVAKGKAPPQHPAFAALAQLPAQLAALPQDRELLIRHAATWIQQRLEQEKHQSATLGFDDLLGRLKAALDGDQGPTLAQVIRGEYPVALIDEFQDTDPTQYGIFAKVYGLGQEQPEPAANAVSASAAGRTGVFLIGDPKQAIYAFRGADIYTYLQAKQDTAGRHYTLGKNYRSTKELVAAVNGLFLQGEQQPEGAFLFKDAIPFIEVEANGRKEVLRIDGQPQAPLTCWQLQSDKPVSTGGYRAALAEACASEMVRLLNLGQQGKAGFEKDGQLEALRPEHMAVLVRAKAEADAIRAALARRGVQSVYLSDKESVYASAEAADLLAWLRASAEPENHRLLRAALASPSLSLGWAELDRLNHDELALEAEVERLKGYQQLWRRQGPLPLVRAWLKDFRLPARLLAGVNGERALTNLLHLAELLQQAATGLDGEQALIRHLEGHLGGNGGEEQILRLESDADLVKVVTIHKSKGLEYPLVFLPFICSFRPEEGKGEYVSYHQDGKRRLDPDKQPSSIEKADRERLAEDLRLLYVALTRPRHACWLGLAAIKKGNARDSNLHRSAIGQLLGGGEPLSAEALTGRLQAWQAAIPGLEVLPLPEATDDSYRPAGQEEPLGQARHFKGPVAEAWWISSYSALKLAEGERIAADTAQGDQLQEDREEPQSRPSARAGAGMHHFPRGPEPGTFLHGLLEWAAGQGFKPDPAELAELLARRCNLRGWGDWAPRLGLWLQELLAAPLTLPVGEPVALSALDGHQAEMEFWFDAHQVPLGALDHLVAGAVLPGRPRPALTPGLLNGMLKGFIDLVFEHQGRFYLADYKSNWLGENDGAYSREAMEQVVLEKRYDLQYLLYCLALHRLLKARLGQGYDHERHFGGALYLFLRGQGCFTDRPSRALLERLDALFAKEAGDAAR